MVTVVDLASAAGLAVLKMMGPATTTFVVEGVQLTVTAAAAPAIAAGGAAAGGGGALGAGAAGAVAVSEASYVTAASAVTAGEGAAVATAGGGLATGLMVGGIIAAATAVAAAVITPTVCAYVEGWETTCDASVGMVKGSIDPEDDNSVKIKYILASEEGPGNVKLYFFPSRATLEQGDKEFGFTCSRLHYQINHQGRISELTTILEKGCAMPYPTIRAALLRFTTTGCGQISGNAEWSVQGNS